jgi:hypothetical protein
MVGRWTASRSAILMSLLLGGCVTQQQAAVAPAVAAVARPPQIVNTGPRTVNRTVAADTVATLDFYLSVNPDCTSRGLSTIRILQQPAHGVVHVVTRDDFPHFPPGNPRFACNVQKLPEVALDYTPAPAFTGPDLIEYEIITPERSIGPVTTVITVK